MTQLQQQFSFLLNPLISTFQKEKEPNLLDIASVSHKELPVSNLYSYFLNPTENHGLKSLFFDSLLELLPVNSFTIGDDQIRIEREVYTFETGKFIDIVVTDGSQVLIIENKVHATLYNDLDAYKNHFKVRNIVGIVLSSRKEKNTGDFFAITHYEWINKILTNFNDSYDFQLNPRQNHNFYTFVEILKKMNITIENLDQSIDFFKSNAAQILAFQKMKDLYAKTIIEQVSNSGQNIGFNALETKKELSIEYTFSDAPGLIFYIYLDENDFSILKSALWIRNNSIAVQTWRNDSNSDTAKNKIKALGLTITTEPNLQGGNTWTPTVTKDYPLNSTDNVLDLSELKNDLKTVWITVIDTLKTHSNP